MEAARVLNLLNSKASTELCTGMLEEARDTVNQAVNYFVSTYSHIIERYDRDGEMLLCQTQISSLLLRKIGVRYQNLGKHRDDAELISIGENMVDRSTSLLRLIRIVPTSEATDRPIKRNARNGPMATKVEREHRRAKCAVAVASLPCSRSVPT